MTRVVGLHENQNNAPTPGAEVVSGVVASPGYRPPLYWFLECHQPAGLPGYRFYIEPLL